MQKITIYTNYPFDSSYENTRLFDTEEERLDYFNARVYTTLNGVNFTFNNLYKTTIEFTYTGKDITEFLNCNYLSVENEGEMTLYYYIIESRLNSGCECTLALELDVMQTYLFYLDFENAMIERAHLDRFIELSNHKLIFNGKYDTKLFKKEPITFDSTYPAKGLVIDPYAQISSITAVNSFFSTHCYGWIKLFVDNKGANNLGDLVNDPHVNIFNSSSMTYYPTVQISEDVSCYYY